MDTVALSVQARSSDLSPRQIRAEGKVPCVVYGNEVKNTSLQCDYNQLHKAYAKAGESTLVELDMEGKKVPTIIHSIDFAPVSGRIVHVDFYAVNMKKEIEAHIPVRITGVSPAVRDSAGILVLVHDHLTVRCLPGDLPHDIEVNIDGLAAFYDNVTVGSVVLPKGVTVEGDPEAVLVTVQEPRQEEVVEAAPVAADAAAAGAEGAAPAAGAEGAAAATAEKKDAKK